MQTNEQSGKVPPEYLDAIRLTLVQQLPCLMLCALLLDFGRTLRLCLIAMLGFWLLAMLCLTRGNHQTDLIGRWFLRWGFFPLLAVVCFVNSFLRQVFPQ